jgi:hypothetical protein
VILIHQRDPRVDSVRIHRILVELLDLTELELRNSIESKWIPVELPRSSYSKDSQQAGKSSSAQNLASLATLQRMNLGAL